MMMESIIESINQHQAEEMAKTAMESAVFVLLVHEGAKISLVMTKRSEKVLYAGDFSLPGGMKEKTDEDYLATARRELKEELGIAEQYQVIGRLDDFLDRYNNRVKVFVAAMSKENFEQQCHSSVDEVAAVYLLPLASVLQFDISPELAQITGRQPSYYYVCDNARIWGLTASILVHFGNVVFHQNRAVGKKKID